MYLCPLIQILSRLSSNIATNSSPIVLTIKKSEIEKEIADLQKVNLTEMFFKKKHKPESVTEGKQRFV